jgi:hypothetical protein
VTRWWWAPALVFAACGGGKDATDSGPAGDDDDTTATVSCDLPQFDLTTMSCDQLASAWRQTVEAGNGCVEASDCTVLRARCEQWYQVDCFYATNATCVTAAELDAFQVEAAGCTTVGDSCTCAGEQPVDCVAGECVIVGVTAR